MTPQVASLCVLLHMEKALHLCDSGACEVYGHGVAPSVLLWVEPQHMGCLSGAGRCV